MTWINMTYASLSNFNKLPIEFGKCLEPEVEGSGKFWWVYTRNRNISRWCFLQDLHLLSSPGTHLFLGNGQDIKKSKSRGVSGARWIESCGQGALGKGNIHKTAITDLSSLDSYLFCKAIFFFLSDWKYFCRYGSVKLYISALDRWIWHKMYPKRNVLHHELAKHSWIHIGIWKLLPLPTKAMT